MSVNGLLKLNVAIGADCALLFATCGCLDKPNWPASADVALLLAVGAGAVLTNVVASVVLLSLLVSVNGLLKLNVEFCVVDGIIVEIGWLECFIKVLLDCCNDGLVKKFVVGFWLLVQNYFDCADI